MSEHQSKYYICKRIDEQKRYFGLPLDELMALAFPVVVCFFAGGLLTGIVIGLAAWMGIKHIKKGQGSAWFLNLMYWYLPTNYIRGVFIKTPTSEKRHWLS